MEAVERRAMARGVIVEGGMPALQRYDNIRGRECYACVFVCCV